MTENEEYMDAYLFMSYENMLKVFEYDDLKVILPEECNDPFEFLLKEEQVPKRWSQDYGFICFSENYTSPMMWGHYADKHKGCCLHFQFPCGQLQSIRPDAYEPDRAIFDYRRLNFKHGGHSLTFKTVRVDDLISEEPDPIIAKVNYQDERPDQKFPGIQMCSEDDQTVIHEINPCFIRKGKMWQYESEWRVIIPIGNPERVRNGMFFVTGFNQWIKNVFLGIKCPVSCARTKGILHYFQSERLRKNPSISLCVYRACFSKDGYNVIVPPYENSL